MTTYTEPTSSITRTRPADIELSLIFDPAAPLAAVDLTIDTQTPALDDAGYLALLDAAIARLHTYRQDYAAAASLLPAPRVPGNAPAIAAPTPRFVGAWRRRVIAARPRPTACPQRRPAAS